MDGRTRELEDKVAVLNKLKADLDVIKAKERKLQVSVSWACLHCTVNPLLPPSFLLLCLNNPPAFGVVALFLYFGFSCSCFGSLCVVKPFAL
jgi:hypothetical protein